MATFDSPIESINKIGRAAAKKLQKLGIGRAGDLLSYYPVRYNDYTQSLPISRLREGMSVNVRGVIDFIQNKRSFRTRLLITEALVRDDTGQLKVVWFNQPFIGKSLKAGDDVSLAGSVQSDFPAQPYGGAGESGVQMVSPEYEKITARGMTHTAGLVPVYGLTAGLTNKQLRFLVKSVIALARLAPDYLPGHFFKKYNLVPLSRAFFDIHFPKNKTALDEARRRLQFDELFFVQLDAQMRKAAVKKQKADKIIFFEKETKNFVNSLPFALTAAQKKAAWEILRDLAKNTPMSRLLEGDVGSGKTVTAALAMLNAALNKKQSALLVPTEILAVQHYETLCALFKNNGVTVGLFTHSSMKVNSKQLKADSKKEMLASLRDGKVHIIVGTHALIQENVQFKNLSLAVVDEQHRFGVGQRQILREKSGRPDKIPHLLSMTATPIPRSLAQVVYGDLDVSIINQLPAGRKIIETYLVPERKRLDAYGFIKKQVLAGRQVFVVCPLISESDKLGVKSVMAEYEKLNKDIFPDLNIAFLHGKLKAREKDKVMGKFLKNEINILVSTSVVEVGVDVPNAAVMVIEGAERFGLAQLHQFRGRVGRSSRQSYCLLFADSISAHSRERLEMFAKSHDGFKLAEADLKMRGPGDVYGTAQKGFRQFKIATFNDYALLKAAREAAAEVVREGPDRYPELRTMAAKKEEWVVG